MDTNTILLIGGLLVVLWLASRFFNRQPTNPTYDDKNTRSGGSLGGDRGQPAQRTHDDANIESGGSFGGRSGQVTPRTHDDPNTRSGGSFGGTNVRSEEPQERSSTGRNPFSERSQSDDAPTAEELRSRRSSPAAPPRRNDNDDPNTRSGGSFGG